jgi:IS605 OrfB family transposase
VSKVIVDYAATHRRAIAIEDLGDVRAKGSKIRSYTERSQWAFLQLAQYIRYKAALRGVEIIEVAPAYSSQECSRCHGLTKPAGKKFACSHCGHNDHRDANAAFTLAQRVMPHRWNSAGRSGPAFGSFGGPVSGEHWRVFRAGEADDMPVSKRNPRVYSGSINVRIWVETFRITRRVNRSDIWGGEPC